MGQEIGAAGPDRSVAVIGGGIAGITAAAKLFRQGYDVTLFEKAHGLGGNLSSNSPDNKGIHRDIYPHIFGDWYKEFWYLIEEDFKLKREDLFVARNKIKMATIPADAKDKIKGFRDVVYDELCTPTTISNVIDNLDGSVLSDRDMFLFGYTYLDLASVPQTPRPLKVLDELDVTGYLYSRPFMSNEIAEFHDDILKVIWSMPSDQTSAKAYQNLIRHTLTFPNETPFAWLARGPLSEVLMEPITTALKKVFTGPSSILLNTEVTEVALDEKGNGVTLTYKTKEEPPSEPRRFQYAVVATPPQAALKLAFQPPGGRNMAANAKELPLLRGAEAGRIPVVYLHFKPAFLDAHRSELSMLPAEMTGFKKAPDKAAERQASKGPFADGDDYDISIVNLTTLWSQKARDTVAAEDPVLVLAASRADAIQAPGPGEIGADRGEAQGFAMIKRLCEYFPFITPGGCWNDEASDIDWKKTSVITNAEHLLFLNDAGSESWRPRAIVSGLNNVFFAGDYCRTDVDMATVEAAVQSGVLAARALQAKAGFGNPICLQAHDLYGANPLLLAKLVLAPAAFAAALTAIYDEACDDQLSAMTLPYTAAVLTTSFWADWLRSAVQLGRGFLPTREWSASGAPAAGNVAEHDHRIGIIQAGINVALALASEGPALLPQLEDRASQALYAAWYWSVGRTLFPNVGRTLNRPPRAPRSSPADAARNDPNTWSGLLSKALNVGPLTPKRLSDTAFGAATAAVSLLQSAKAVTPPNSKPSKTPCKDAFRKAIQEGATARQRRARGFNVYTAERPIVPGP